MAKNNRSQSRGINGPMIEPGSDIRRHAHLPALEDDRADSPRFAFLLLDEAVQPALRGVEVERFKWASFRT